MPLFQMPLGSQTPLVPDSIGAARFRLYRATSSLLGLRLPLVTKRLILGAQTRIPLSRRANRRFPGDWDLGFPLVELELQNHTKEFIPTEVSQSALQAVSELAEPSPIEPLTEPHSALLQTESVRLISPQPESAKPRSQRINSPKQMRGKPNKTSSQTEVLQIASRFEEQPEGSQFTVVIPNQEQEGKQPQSNTGYPVHLRDELNQVTETTSLTASSNSAFEPYSEEDFVEVDVQEFPNSSHSVLELTKQQPTKQLAAEQLSVKQPSAKQQRRQESKLNSAKQKHNQKPSKQKNEKQSINFKKQSKSKQKLETEQLSAPENYNFSLGTSEFTSSIFVTADNIISERLPELSCNTVDDGYSITESSAYSDLTQPDQSEQNRQAELLAKPKSLAEAATQPPIDSESQASTETVFTAPDQQNIQPKADRIPESSVDLLTQSVEATAPLQGFSVGGQVTASNTPAKPIDPSDTVPAMLTPGEFVVNAANAQKHLPLLRHINQGGSLEEIGEQVQVAEVSQADRNSQERAARLAPTHLQRFLKLSIHQPLVDSETKSLQSGIFEEPDFSQPDRSRQFPELIFRSHQSATTFVSSASPSDSLTEWNNVEDLLQITDTEANASWNGESTNNSQLRSTSISSSLAGNESVANSPQVNALQPTTETIKQADTNDKKHTNESKTLETVMEILAQEIYGRLRQRLVIERERQGVYAGRLPW